MQQKLAPCRRWRLRLIPFGDGRLQPPSFVSTALCFLLASAVYSRADRIVLSPDGNTLPPRAFKIEAAYSPNRDALDRGWLQVSTVQGIELEAHGVGNSDRLRFGFNLQYPLLTDFGAYPAVSLGVRDLFNTGSESRALYLAVAKTVPLSDRQLRTVREFKLNAGVGTERIGGLFAGAQARFAAGFTLYAEIYRRRANFSVGLPLVRNLQAKAYSLDGTPSFGLTYTLAR